MKNLLIYLFLLISCTSAFAEIEVSLAGPECANTSSFQNFIYTGEIVEQPGFLCRVEWTYTVDGGMIIGKVTPDGEEVFFQNPTPSMLGVGYDVDQIIVNWDENNACNSVTFKGEVPWWLFCRTSEDIEVLGVNVNYTPGEGEVDIVGPEEIQCGNNLFRFNIDSECSYTSFEWQVNGETVATSTRPRAYLTINNCPGNFILRVIATGPCNSFSYFESFQCSGNVSNPISPSIFLLACEDEGPLEVNIFCNDNLSNVSFDPIQGVNGFSTEGCLLFVSSNNLGTTEILATYTICGVTFTTTIEVRVRDCEGGGFLIQNENEVTLTAEEKGLQESSNKQYLETFDNPAAFSDLKIYPNPVSDILYLEKTEGLIDQLIVSSIDQKVHIIKRSISENKHSLDVSSLPSGIYIINIITNGESTTKKFVKQ